MTAVRDILAAKRDGRELSLAEIGTIVAGIASGALADAQVGAFAMATVLKGMTPAETVALTRAMAASGRTLDWRDVADGRPVVDKHSSGGVGDKVSLMLAPIIAASGGLVPMISGRGLGHTGGKLDKLATIPGYRVDATIEDFRAAARDVGCAIVGATGDLAPADRRLYAVRDVTATVESLPLITASILSKKFAAGLDVLVLDVKTGSGAFMARMESARELASSLVEVARLGGLKARALITDMNQVLGGTAGNAVEVMETVAYLRGDARDARLHGVVMALAGEMLVEAGLAPTVASAVTMAEGALADGGAADRFARMVAALGGPADFLDHAAKYLPAAPVTIAIPPPRPGVLTSLDVRAIGMALVAAGAGRGRPDDGIDGAVGLTGVAGIGDVLDAHRPFALCHAASQAEAERTAAAISAALTMGDAPTVSGPVVLERL